jgi:hypothetical protein
VGENVPKHHEERLSKSGFSLSFFFVFFFHLFHSTEKKDADAVTLVSREKRAAIKSQRRRQSKQHTHTQKRVVVNLKIMTPPVGRLVRLPVGCTVDMFMSLRKKERNVFKRETRTELDDLFLLSFFVLCRRFFGGMSTGEFSYDVQGRGYISFSAESCVSAV